MPMYAGPLHLRYADGLMEIWTGVELSQVPIAAEIILEGCLHHPTVKAAIAAYAKEVQAYWKSIAPVSTRPAHPLSKYSKDNPAAWDHPGDYRDSIKIRYWKNDRGHGARVYTRDAKAHWIEWGTSKMPEQAPAARTREHFGGDHEHNPKEDVAMAEKIGLEFCRIW